MFPRKKTDRCNARQSHTVRMRREASPHDRPAKAQVIEKTGLISKQTRRKNVAFPCNRGGFKAGHLSNDLPDSIFTMELCIRCSVLPLEKDAHEIRRCHRLDFPPQATQSQSMNSRQQAAVAPLDRRIGFGVAEMTAQNLSFSLKPEKRAMNSF